MTSGSVTLSMPGMDGSVNKTKILLPSDGKDRSEQTIDFWYRISLDLLLLFPFVLCEWDENTLWNDNA